MSTPDHASQGGADEVERTFAHPAFGPAKEMGASFVLLAEAACAVVWANAAALKTLGARSETLPALFGSRPFGAALPIPPGAAGASPRFARLHIKRGAIPTAVTVLYRRLAGADGRGLLGLAFPGEDGKLRSARTGSGMAPHWRDGPRPSAPADADRDARPREPARSGPDRLEDRAETPAARFVWQTDDEGCFHALDRRAFEGLGEQIDLPVPGTFAQVVAPFDPEGAARLADAFATRATWAGVEVRWPVARRHATVPVTFSAVPIFDATRRFAGFRGFAQVDRHGLAPFRPEALPADTRESHTVVPAGDALPLPSGVDASVAAAPARPTNIFHLRPPVLQFSQAVSRAETAAARGSRSERAMNEAPGPAKEATATFPSLSTSEHLAFQEIGRRLAGGGTEASGPALTGVSGEEPGVGLAHPFDVGGSFTGAKVPRSTPLLESVPPIAGEPHVLQGLLDATGDAVMLLDDRGSIRTLNRQGMLWFARAGDSYASPLAPESAAAAAAVLAKARGQSAGAAPSSCEVSIRTAASPAVPMRLTIGRIGPDTLYAVWRDLSARADTGRLANDLPNNVGQGAAHPGLLAKLSHDIRTPLNAILGFTEIMMDERLGQLGKPRYKEYLRDIHASGTRVLGVVTNLLDLSRIEAGNIDLDITAIDLNKMIGESVSAMQVQAHRERVIMRMSLGHRLPGVWADERSVRQIVVNLLSNAVKFNEPGGQVIVSTALDEEGRVAVRIRDTGIGMSQDDLEAALGPFQAAASSKPDGGAGLGLPLTRALVGANGASMSIRSRPKQGTLVEVVFPAAAEPGVRMPA